MTGRLSRKRVELQERKREAANLRFTTTVSFSSTRLWWIHCEDAGAKLHLPNGFDFLASEEEAPAENFMLLALIRDRRATAYDDTCRQALEMVWPCEQQTGSSGWRRQRFASATGAVPKAATDQFTCYSGLLFLNAQAGLTRKRVARAGIPP